MNIKENLKYTKDHEWIKLDGNIATVGITDFAQSELGDIVYVEVETLDETLDKDDVFGTVEAVKTVSDLFLPMSGKIIEFNENLSDSPESINDSSTIPIGSIKSFRSWMPTTTSKYYPNMKWMKRFLIQCSKVFGFHLLAYWYLYL